MAKWTKEEIQVLKEMWDNPNIFLDDMDKVLKSRTRESIRKKAAELRLPPIRERRVPEIDRDYYRKLQEVIPA